MVLGNCTIHRSMVGIKVVYFRAYFDSGKCRHFKVSKSKLFFNYEIAIICQLLKTKLFKYEISGWLLTNTVEVETFTIVTLSKEDNSKLHLEFSSDELQYCKLKFTEMLKLRVEFYNPDLGVRHEVPNNTFDTI